MSFREEWQLVAHQPDLTPAEGAVAQAIARRLKPDSESVLIPLRTLLAESVGVRSKDTIERALIKLESLGVIQVIKPRPGSRQPSKVRWLLTCPEGCEQDHSRANERLRPVKDSPSQKATRPNPQDKTRPNPQDALRSKERERSSLVSFIEQTLSELPNPSALHLELLAALENPAEVELVRARADLLFMKAEQDGHAYLKAIITSSPHKLKPKPTPEQAPPDFSHLAPEIAAAQMRKWEKLLSERAV
jgi:hypothetical protein